MVKRIVRKKKDRRLELLKKWFPIIILVIMISPSIFYGLLNKSPNEIDITIQFEIYGQESQENIKVTENATFIEILYRYPVYVENDTIFCLGQLCEDEGNWTFIVDSVKIDPFDYMVKDKDVIILMYE